MDDILFARLQMAVSLGFHILFASIGITMPLLMVLAEWKGRRHGDGDCLALAKAWAKGTAVFFAIGAVSGTVLAFELGLLFPNFMKHAGAVIGMPFSLEGFAFFTEAIFLGIYLYGWDRLSPAHHMAAGVVVALSGAASAFFVTIANAWMNAPRGFRVENGAFVDIDPIAAMGSPFVLHEVTHMLAAAYVGTGFAVAGIHAWLLLRNPKAAFHRKALNLALWVAVPFALVQPLIGHFAGQQVARHQPMKLAAMESLFETSRRAPLVIGGIPDYENDRIHYGIPIPGLLSFLAADDPNAEVKGLREFPKSDWPHPVVRWAFQAMVATGTILFFLSAYFLRRRDRALTSRRFLRAVVLVSPLGYLATEAGWIVTEVGRQPWTVYGVMRTADAATSVKGLWLPFVIFSGVYLVLGIVVAAVLARHVRLSPGWRKP